MAEESKTFMIEDARLIFRNFKGAEGEYNRKGERSFGIILPDDLANDLLRDGWNVKYLREREEEEGATPFISVSVRFDVFPPRVILLTSTTRTNLDEASVEVLDWADIKMADLICRGHHWDVNGKQGIKAYLQSLFVTIEEDPLERKYAIHEHPAD